jgi:uncharacterized protein (TIGR03083 family)
MALASHVATSEATPLMTGLVRAFEHSLRSLLSVCDTLDDADWACATDLPGWTVGDVVAHLSAIECELVGDPVAPPPPDYGPHVRDAFGRHMENGVAARRSVGREAVVAELRDVLDRRLPQLHAMREGDPPQRVPAGRPWDTLTFLSNRAVDAWMHEQDVRRATGRPGNLDGPGAYVVLEVIRRALPYVLAKRAGAAPGRSVRIDVSGDVAAALAARVTDEGRGTAADAGDLPAPSAVVTVGWEGLVTLFGGRRPADAVPREVTGDEALAATVLRELALTP